MGHEVPEGYSRCLSCFRPSTLKLEEFINVDLAGNNDSRKSTVLCVHSGCDYHIMGVKLTESSASFDR